MEALDLERKAQNLLIAVENELNDMEYARALRLLMNMIEVEYQRGYERGRADKSE